MIKKISALGFFVLSFVMYGKAQTVAPAANPGGIIIKGGVNFSNITTHSNGTYNDANTLTSFNVGVLADLPVASVLSIQPGVVLTGKGSKAHSSILNTTTKFNPLYLEVPVNVLVKLPVGADSRVFFGAGPYAAWGVGGKWKTTSNIGDVSKDIEFGDSNSDDLKRFDYGINALAGLEISRFVVGVNYGLGLAKIYPNEDDNDRDNKNKFRTFSINVGVRL